ncbi:MULTISPECIES: dihydrofolate reductase [Planococcus]|uniref:Dihydrofolate reductase n=1 Tax=Planococcus faecalis TaxID=1598147 RepID=A0ABN4XQV8_9BACL|nr:MULTISPECIES: dihydrofolate reductase [Planococcus]AQU79445.1 dihydrofolate reductase [Planococcus faecalis]MDJ0332523.1 dihydrofolate reductase [Planococcus sp. S3-L1]OHX51414.1 dihydrofolate reductase [Planococcus faecalis]
MISLMVAHDPNRVIGKDNELPWHIPADLAYFKKQTIGKGIVMGRNTYESIGRPLPKRRNIVVTRNDDYQADGVDVVHNVQDAIKLATEFHEEVMIIGGEQIFESILPDADRLYITLVHQTFDGDTYFPEYGREWKLVSESEQQISNEVPFSYLVYERRRKKTANV